MTRVQITDPENKKLEVIVEDSQLSLAIGKKGQNVRLASKLIAWDIDIKSEEEKRREIEAEMTALTAPVTPLTALAGVGPKTIEKIEAAGITSLEQLAGMTPEQLMEIPGIGEKMVDKIYQAVNQFYESGGTPAAEGAAAETAAEAGSAEETAEAVIAEGAEELTPATEEAQPAESTPAEEAQAGNSEKPAAEAAPAGENPPPEEEKHNETSS